MPLSSKSYDSCMNTVDWLRNETDLYPQCNGTHKLENVLSLYGYCKTVYESDVLGGSYSKPMLWIGIYIAVATLFCIIPMAADLLHGFRHKKLWFPCKFFTLNAASITVITIAMKLPVDLNNPMPGMADQFAKLGSMAFMCTMMANLMPSLASIEDKELLANVIGLVILVITMVVNVLIQVNTGLIQNYYIVYYVACTYVVMMLYLLIISISLALTTPSSKQILELKYQAKHKTSSNDKHPQATGMSTVEELQQHVRRYWVMAGTCSPQFVMASTPLCSAAGIVCASITLIHLYQVLLIIYDGYYSDCNSDYKWSLLVVLITQTIGVVVGTIAPIFRCFATLSFKLSLKWSKNHVNVFKVEKYWTQKLSEWKESHLPFPSSGRKSKTLVHNSKNLILRLCIVFQNVIVVSCKMMRLIPVGVVVIFVYCLYCWKSLKAIIVAKLIASSHDTRHKLEQNDSKEDIANYALQLQDEMELSKRTLKSISNSLHRLIQKAEKKLPNNLLEFLEKSKGFEGVENFDSDQVQPLLRDELPNSWSLPVVTLTCIAISLPNIDKIIVQGLLKSVGEGLSYTHLVDETLNNESKFLNIHRATMILWDEIECNCMWLENTLPRNSNKVKTPKEILKWFAEKAEEIVEEIKKSTNGAEVVTSPNKLIAANSMYRIAKTTMLNNQNSIEQFREEQLFTLLSGTIADILAACLTNLPRVIETKCHESVIEKREASVEAAAKLLGRTKEILNKLQLRNLPSLDPEQMSFIDEWRVYLKQSIP